MHLLTVFPDYIVATTRAEAAAEAAAARAEAAAEAQKEACKSKAFKDPTFCLRSGPTFCYVPPAPVVFSKSSAAH